ncbi:MAG: anthranilate phosphoribosyltransferase [Epsilonproteobacteria bacterium]|nr:anthranilate phosphoribosyltransferase [Campylobacterota bacterium]
MREHFEKLFKNELSPDEAREFLIDLYNRGESGEEIAIASSIMRDHSIKLPISDDLKSKIIDIVGTGGDRSGTFNISTTVSLLLASIGSYVAKHGNRSITSRSGSADLLEGLGINLNLTPKQQVKMLEESRFCFMFAINHHPAMKHIMPVRKSIEHRTIFNLLGPLTSPAGAKKYLLGVFSPEYIEKMATALIRLNTERAFVVSSLDGMDEISLSSNTEFAYIEGGKYSSGEIDPEKFGFKKVPKEAILGGDSRKNGEITLNIFRNRATRPQKDIVILNGGYALFADGISRDLKEGFEMVRDAIESGRAREHLELIKKISNGL